MKYFIILAVAALALSPADARPRKNDGQTDYDQDDRQYVGGENESWRSRGGQGDLKPYPIRQNNQQEYQQGALAGSEFGLNSYGKKGSTDYGREYNNGRDYDNGQDYNNGKDNNNDYEDSNNLRWKMQNGEHGRIYKEAQRSSDWISQQNENRRTNEKKRGQYLSDEEKKW